MARCSQEHAGPEWSSENQRSARQSVAFAVSHEAIASGRRRVPINGPGPSSDWSLTRRTQRPETSIC